MDRSPHSASKTFLISIKMKHAFNFFRSHKMSLLSLLFVAIATALGADSSFAMAEVALTGDGDGFSKEYTAGAEDTKGLETQHQGEGATAGAAREAGLEVEEIDQIIAKFRPFRFPLEWFITNRMQQSKAQSYEQTHYRSGATVLEAITAEDFTSSGTFAKKNVAFSVSVDKFVSGVESIHEYDTIYVQNVTGYADDGTTEDGGLFLFVTKKDEDSCRFAVINPPAAGNVTIPAGSKFVICGNACSESQMVVDPETYLPSSDTLFLQKKISNIVMTDEWLEQARKVKFVKKDVVDNGLYNHKRKCARSHWLGRQFMTTINVKDAKIGAEPVYFERGILRQVNMSYMHSGDDYNWNDLIAISKMMFTENAANTTAVGLCGKNAMQRLLRLAANVDVQRSLKYERNEEMGVSIHKWHDGFGTIEFMLDPTLDDIGYQDFIVILDLDNAVHYVKKIEAETEQDLKKTGEAREAQRRIIQTIDCVGLKGYNSMIVGPADAQARVRELGGVNIDIMSSETLSGLSGLKDKMVVYLTADDGEYKAGESYQYDASSRTWSIYDGTLEEA